MTDFITRIIEARSADEFLDSLLGAISHDFQTVQDRNFDKNRFPDQNEDTVDTERRVFFMKWLHENYTSLFQAFTQFEDNDSKLLFQELIRFRVAGHRHVKLQTNNPAHWQARKQTKKTPCTPSQFHYPGQFGTLDLCSFTWKNKHIKLHTFQLALAWYMSYRQYYFDRGGVSIRPNKNDAVIDGGGCLGDSTIFLGLSVGENGKVYCFDFAVEHLQIIEENVKLNQMENIEIVPMGLSDQCTEGKPISLGKIWPGNRIAFHDQPLPLTTLDCFVHVREIERVDFIKLDIEGAELDCLQGAQNTIEKFCPKLAISLYHKPNDFFEIPLWLTNRFPDYKLYLDHYTIHEEETVLYAMSESSNISRTQEKEQCQK